MKKVRQKANFPQKITFGLVRFTDNSLGIYNFKNITQVNDTICLVKHKGTKFEAKIIATNDDLNTLNQIKEHYSAEVLVQDTHIIENLNSMKHTEQLQELEQKATDQKLSIENSRQYITRQLITAKTNTQELIYIEQQPSNISVNSLDFSNISIGSESIDVPNTSSLEDQFLKSLDTPYCDPDNTQTETVDQEMEYGQETNEPEDNNTYKIVESGYSEGTPDPFEDDSFTDPTYEPEENPSCHVGELPGSIERKKIIEIIRKEGCFKFNNDENYNDGHLIVTRRPRNNLRKVNSDYRVCPCCKGMYSKLSIRKHYPKCVPNWKKGNKAVSIMGKLVQCQVHKKACTVLKNNIFPVLREDECTRIIRYDPLIITYGNSLCAKYRLEHLYKMIRTKLRLLGRFMLALKKIDTSVSDFASTFYPARFDSVIVAVNSVAELNLSTQEYKSPSTAFELGTTLKKCGKLLITEYIKERNAVKKAEVEDFLKIFDEEFSSAVNKTVMENQLQHKRKKKLLLPSLKDVIDFNNYIESNRCQSYDDLKNNFSFSTWKNLASYALISIQIFNRRRAGELERFTIEDFNTFQSIDQNTDPDLFKTVPTEFKANAKKYLRCVIRGKRARGVPVLLSSNMFKSIQLILKYRKEAGVPDTNPYVFGLPSRTLQNSHLSACDLMRKFSQESGITNHCLLRGTQLRKQIATQSSMLNLDDTEVKDLANFLGHADKIHYEHYRIPVVSREIGRISKLLEMGVGKANENERNSQGEEAFVHEVPNESTSSDNVTENVPLTPNRDSWNDDNEFQTVYEKERCVSPYGYVKRTSWSTPEKVKAKDLFKEHILLGDLPSLPECSIAITDNCELSRRTPKQLKAWVANQITKNKKPMNQQKSTKKVYWSSEEKNVMRLEFKKYLDSGILPSLPTCSDIQKRNPILKMRTDVTMKAWINNELRKNKKS